MGEGAEEGAPAAHELVEVAVEALEHEVELVQLAHHLSQAHDVRVVHLPQRLQHNQTSALRECSAGLLVGIGALGSSTHAPALVYRLLLHHEFMMSVLIRDIPCGPLERERESYSYG